MLCLLAIGCSSSSQQPPHIPTYTTFDPPGSAPIPSQGTHPVGITDSGVVAGYFYDSQPTAHGFLRDSTGTFTVFDVPDSLAGNFIGTVVSAVNNSGAVTGTYYGQDQQLHAFTRTSNGQYVTLAAVSYIYLSTQGFLIQGFSSSLVPTTMNDNGDVAGYFYDPNLGVHAFISAASGGPIAFDAPNSVAAQEFGTHPFYLSVKGEAVGTFADKSRVFHGFVRHTDGSFTVLDAPGFATAALTGTAADYIAADGTIVGSASDSQINHSFVRTPDGSYTVFDPPNTGAPGSGPLFVSLDGVMVGNFVDVNSVRHGYLRNSDNTFTIIDEPEAAQIPNFTGTNITGVNNSGEIVGYYQDAQGSTHGFIRK